MDHLFDEFSKSLSESLPRRESLRRLGAVFAGAVLGPLGLQRAWAGPKQGGAIDPCQTFCKCRNKTQQTQCLKVCRACQSDTSRVCGSCGNYVCCAAGQSCCSGHCTSLQNDVLNCGGCGRNCGAPGANEFVACVAGLCTYDCVPGAVDCNGTCTFLESDPAHCGACGNVCPDSAPVCTQGVCVDCSAGLTNCSGVCTDVRFDSSNCGACGNVCPASAPTCDQGTCTDVVCPGGGTLCFGVCTNISFDTLNCGGCGIQCGDGQTCSGGICQYPF